MYSSIRAKNIFMFKWFSLQTIGDIFPVIHTIIVRVENGSSCESYANLKSTSQNRRAVNRIRTAIGRRQAFENARLSRGRSTAYVVHVVRRARRNDIRSRTTAEHIDRDGALIPSRRRRFN
jgi:hypothetical protein